MKWIRILSDKFEGRNIEPKQLKWSPIPQFPACQIIDFLEYLQCDNNRTCSLLEIIFDVAKLENIGMSINLQERNKVNHRTVKVNALSSSGPRMQNKDLMNPRNLKYIVRFHQHQYSGQDLSKKCVYYPNSKFRSYDECDKSFIRKKLKEEKRKKKDEQKDV